MSYQQPQQRDPYDDTWAGLEPAYPPPNGGGRWLGWLAAGAAILLLTCLCVAGGYVIYQQFGPQSATSPPPLAIPTVTVIAGPIPGTGQAQIPTLPPGSTNPPPGSTNPPPTPPIIPSATLPLQPTVTLPAQPSATVAGPVPGAANALASQLTTAPTIDGDLGEWGDEPVYQSAYRVYNVDGWDGTADMTASWRLGWDGTNLYVAVEVLDDIHVQTQTGNQIFRGDSLDMQFDTNRSNSPTEPSPDNFQFILSPGDFGGLPPAAFRFQGTDNGQILDAPGGHHVTVAAQATSSGYALEAAIPWSDLNTTPSPGLVLGLALNANDNDTPGTAVQEVMMSHVPGRTLTNPSTWGTLTLR
jgi:hypothetical protein